MSAIDHHDDHADEPWLGHHWNDSNQQFEAGKLGMWLFLATEFLLFAGLFCAYAVYRSNHPELFEYGAKFLDWKLGAINTTVLISSSFTMAWAVTAAQRGQIKLMNFLLFITLFGGVGFLGIKYIEYTSKFKDNIYWGTALYQEIDGVTHDLSAMEVVEYDDDPLIDTRFSLPEPQPENLSAVAEAPSGPSGLSLGGLALLDADQFDQQSNKSHDEHHSDEGHHAHDEHHSDEGHHAHDEHHSDEGHAHHHPNPRIDPERPANAHIYFGIYYTMTGLHGAHVIIGMIVIAWLFLRGMRGDFSAKYFTPVDLGGLYWHVVDLIWIFLFPLLYLV